MQNIYPQGFEIPDFSKEFIVQQSVPRSSMNSIVYFLVKGNEIVYVGQSKHGSSRMYSHRDKDFDRVYYIEVNPGILNEVETHYILKFAPKYNKVLNNGGEVSLNTLRNVIKSLGFSDPRFNIHAIKKALLQFGIKEKSICGLSYINREDACIVLDAFMNNQVRV